ncbi:MAG TPA: peptidyl-prolyl cis-trans isomerase [Steroidobacteraceae bacterium]|jgi:peptidyl-prolyl cis-trans isomerase D
MLQGIRDGFERHKWLMYILLGALALIFAAWGAYGIVNISFTGATYAAEAGGQKVSLEAARNAWIQQQSSWQQQFGGEIPPSQKLVLQDHLLESMIRRALLTERAHDLGYRVSEADVREAIRNEPAFQLGGKYSPEIAKERLAQAGISLAAFEDDLRGALQRSQIQSGIALSDFQTSSEIQRARALEDEEREVRYALLPAEKYSADIPVDDAAVEAYYKAHQAEYMRPEQAHLQYAELRLDTLAAQIKPSDADLKAAYDKNKDRYVEPEKRHASHILIQVGKDDAAARKRAEDVLAQAKAGKDFAALAKQYSQDPGSASKGGDLGWTDRSQFVKPFTDALFSMKVGDIVGPVKTQFGYHIIKLDETQPGKAKSFDEVRADLEAELKRNAATDRFGEIQEQLQSKVDQTGNDLDVLAKQFNLQTGDIPHYLRGAGAAPLGAAQPVQDLVFGDSALPPGRIGGPVLVGEDRLVLVKVLDHRKPEPKPVAEVRDAIVAVIRKDRGSQAALKAAQDGMAKLEAGTSFDDIVKSLGVSSQPARFISRKDTVIPAQLRGVVFNTPKPDKALYRAVALQTGGAALLEVTKLRTEPAQSTPQELQARLQQQAQLAKQDAERHGQADAIAYVEELRRTANVRKNPKAFE